MNRDIHRKKHKKHVKKPTLAPCPTPQKKRYITYGQASNALIATWSKGYDIDFTDLRPYKCKCGYYHLGHQSKFENFLKKKSKKEQGKNGNSNILH